MAAVVNGEMPVEAFTRSVADVAALLRARTKNSAGEEVGTFNDDTRPTSPQVLTLIGQAVVDVQTVMGVSPPDYLADAAKSTATLRAAMCVELSYYPEQVRNDRSAYHDYAQMYEAQVRGLQDAARGAAPGGGRVFSVAIPVPGVDPLPVPLAVTNGTDAA
jgi:hypothetical protein